MAYVQEQSAPELSPEEAATKYKVELLNRLAEIDTESVRLLRAIASGPLAGADSAKLDALDAGIAELRSQLSALNS